MRWPLPCPRPSLPRSRSRPCLPATPRPTPPGSRGFDSSLVPRAGSHKNPVSRTGRRARIVAMDDDALTYLALMRLQRAYADIATRRAWSEVTSLAVPDARFSFDTRSGRVVEVIGAAA